MTPSFSFFTKTFCSKGAYYLSSAAVQRIISIPLAKYTDSRVFGEFLRFVVHKNHRLKVYI